MLEPPTKKQPTDIIEESWKCKSNLLIINISSDCYCRDLFENRISI